MRRIQWVKQLTRENTLLDRSFRVLAYKDSVKEIGKAAIKSPIVGFGRITSLYYDPIEYKFQQSIILSEFSGSSADRMGGQIYQFMEEGYAWAKGFHGMTMSAEEFKKYADFFVFHHAHARGAITYSYWGEPAITAELKALLAEHVAEKDLDTSISILSVPKSMNGELEELHHSSIDLIKKRESLIHSLPLSSRERELIEILSWFTLLYELGERVSSYLFTEFLSHLTYIVKEDMFEELQWYDPASFFDYINTGKRLDAKELERRKQCYIIEVVDDELQLISGEDARERYISDFEEEIPETNSQSLTGTVASKGIVRGRTRLVITQEDQYAMQEGEILVSTMTTPQLMAAMKKAAAIVTDEGGLTAHAAIVARELSIPCIVGTKFATRAFKDGDMVEVDADRGIVSKIN